jgi:hypothetical protein
LGYQDVDFETGFETEIGKVDNQTSSRLIKFQKRPFLRFPILATADACLEFGRKVRDYLLDFENCLGNI